MPEATFICFDTSSSLRNKDFFETRWYAMKKTIDLICSQKLAENIQNNLGLISMKYDSTDIILNLCEERRWNASLTQVKLCYGEGNIQIDVAIKKARLALKYKRNPKQTRRIIVLVASPVKTDQKNLISIAKDLKKNKISLDIICFGVSKNHTTKTVKKLSEMIRICNHTNNCHFLHLENEKKTKLQDIILRSDIIKIGGNFPLLEKEIQENSNQFEKLENFPDIDPQTDPELYHAIRLSIKMARQETKRLEGTEKSQSNSIQNSFNLNSGAKINGEMEKVKSIQLSDIQKFNENNLACAISMSIIKDDIIIKDNLKKLKISKEKLNEKRNFLKKLIKELPRIKEDEINVGEIIKTTKEREFQK